MMCLCCFGNSSPFCRACFLSAVRMYVDVLHSTCARDVVFSLMYRVVRPSRNKMSIAMNQSAGNHSGERWSLGEVCRSSCTCRHAGEFGAWLFRRTLDHCGFTNPRTCCWFFLSLLKVQWARFCLSVALSCYEQQQYLTVSAKKCCICCEVVVGKIVLLVS